MSVARSSGETAAAASARSKLRRGRGKELLPGERVGVRALDQHDQLERGAAAVTDGERALQVRRLGDEHATAGVADDVLGLLDGERRVDRERGRAKLQGGRIRDVELRTVGQPHRDGVAAPHADPIEARGGVADVVGVLAPGPRQGPVGRPQRRLLGVGRGG